MNQLAYNIIELILFIICIDRILVARQNGWLHHYYIGFVIETIGILTYCLPVYILGAAIKYDDLVQHLFQTFVNRNFQSIIHIAFRPVYKFRVYLVNITGWKWLEKV